MQLDGCQSVSLANEMRSGLNLLALGVRRRRSRTVVIDAAVILLAGTFVMVVQGDFFGFLVSFVQLLACGIATWAAVFIVDMPMRRGYGRACLESSGLVPTNHPAQLAADRGVRLPALIAWLAGTVVGLLFTASPLFTGSPLRFYGPANSLPGGLWPPR